MLVALAYLDALSHCVHAVTGSISYIRQHFFFEIGHYLRSLDGIMEFYPLNNSAVLIFNFQF